MTIERDGQALAATNRLAHGYPATVSPSAIAVPLFVLFLFFCDIGLAVLYPVNRALDYPLRHLVNLDGEANLASWYASSQLFFVGLLVSLIASEHMRRVGWQSWPLGAMAALFFTLSIDETVQLHERIGAIVNRNLLGDSRSSSPFWRTGVWMFVLGPPFVLVGFFLLKWVRRYFIRARGAWFKLWFGALLMVAGGLGLESLSNLPTDSPIYIAEVTLEELCELLGVTLMLWAAYDLARHERLLGSRARV